MAIVKKSWASVLSIFGVIIAFIMGSVKPAASGNITQKSSVSKEVKLSQMTSSGDRAIYPAEPNPVGKQAHPALDILNAPGYKEIMRSYEANKLDEEDYQLILQDRTLRKLNDIEKKMDLMMQKLEKLER